MHQVTLRLERDDNIPMVLFILTCRWACFSLLLVAGFPMPANAQHFQGGMRQQQQKPDLFTFTCRLTCFLPLLRVALWQVPPELERDDDRIRDFSFLPVVGPAFHSCVSFDWPWYLSVVP